MKNIKKIILFLGAIALIGWGNYVKQKSKIVEVTTNNPSGNINSLGNSTTIENKLPESSTSSKGKDENKNFIKKKIKEPKELHLLLKYKKKLSKIMKRLNKKQKKEQLLPRMKIKIKIQKIKII